MEVLSCAAECVPICFPFCPACCAVRICLGHPSHSAESGHHDAGSQQAKGKQVLQDLINGLGGPGYLEVKDLQCHGRRAQFGHNGEVMGFTDFTNARRYPDKERIEYTSKGRNSFLGALIGIDGLGMIKGGAVITVFNGDRGWLLDRSGVNELPVTSISDFEEANKRNVDNLLRFRLREDGMSIRFGGGGTVDLKAVDWVELKDKDQ